jgi:fatty acid desaturase
MPIMRLTEKQKAEIRRVNALPWDALTRTQKGNRVANIAFDWLAVVVMLLVFCWLWIPIVVIYGVCIVGTHLYDYISAIGIADSDGGS